MSDRVGETMLSRVEVTLTDVQGDARLPDGATVVVDGYTGTVIVEPPVLAS